MTTGRRNSNGKPYLGYNQFLGCGIAGFDPMAKTLSLIFGPGCVTGKVRTATYFSRESNNHEMSIFTD
jgi:hypothetical protein